MPIPKVKDGQTEAEYVSDCISAIYDEYGQEQAAAICYNTYRSEVGMSTESKIASKLREIQYKGIDTIKLAEGLEDACWPGYTAVGLKPLGDRMVPNCVPEEEMAKQVETFAENEGIRLADYPWDECIADQTARYESEEVAKRVCGWIKSNYGS